MSAMKHYIECNCNYVDGEFVFEDGYGDNPPEHIEEQRLIKAGFLKPQPKQETSKYAYSFSCVSDPDGVAHMSLYIYQHNSDGTVVDVKCYGDAALNHAKFLMGNSYFDNQQYLEKLFQDLLAKKAEAAVPEKDTPF